MTADPGFCEYAAAMRKPLPKMMLGFVVRRCAAVVGHEPSPEEFAEWANNHREGTRRFSVFGRPISVGEARLILRHPGREVSACGAAPHECVVAEERPALQANVRSLAAARLRRRNVPRRKP